MNRFHAALLAAHIATGSLAVIAFWLPVIARKGGRFHVTAGRAYAWAMYAVSATAIAMSLAVLIDPVGVRFPERNLSMTQAFELANGNRMFALFLLMLGLLVLGALRHGLLALRVRRGEDALARPGHRALLAAMGITGIVVGIIGLSNGELLLIFFSVFAVTGGVGMLRETRSNRLTPRDALIAHFNGLIGTGVGAYTALFAFGVREFLSGLLSGQWQILPWIAPAIIGTLVVSRLKRRYVETGTTPRYRERSMA